MLKIIVPGLFASAFCLASFGSCGAAGGSPFAETEAVLSKYVESTGCGFHLEKGNFVELRKSPVEGVEAAFAAVYEADVGCCGGSGTVFPYIAVLARDCGTGEDLHVVPSLSGPVLREGMPRRVERLEALPSGNLLLHGLEYAEDDPACCPSKKVRIEMTVGEAKLPSGGDLPDRLFFWKPAGR